MRVLLDECLPRRLKRELVGHDARTAPAMGWASKRNGELLALAVGQFDVFLTADRNVSYQQDLSLFDIAIVLLVARSNRFEDLRPPAPRFLEILPTAKRGAATLVRQRAAARRAAKDEDTHRSRVLGVGRPSMSWDGKFSPGERRLSLR